MPTLTATQTIAADILRERHGAAGPITVHETWGASIVVEADNLLLKANGDRSTTAETFVTRRVRAAGVPAPEIIDHGTDARLPGGQWIVMARMPGVDFAPRESTAAEVDTTIRDVARHLTTLRDVRLPGWGCVGEDGRGKSDSWREWLHQSFSAAITQLGDRLAASFATAVRRAVDATPEPRHGSILNGDLGLSHILVDPTTSHVTGVLDWADALVGDPVYDVAIFSMGGPAGDPIQDVLQPRLVEAYGADPDDPRLPLYRALNHVNNACWSIANDVTSWTDDLCRDAARLLDQC